MQSLIVLLAASVISAVTTNPAQEGAMCGGIAAIQCAPGLTCHITHRTPTEPSGVCVKKNTYRGAGLGQKCLAVSYGKKGPDCRSGLTCKLKNKRKPSLGGVCIKKYSTSKYQ